MPAVDAAEELLLLTLSVFASALCVYVCLIQDGQIMNLVFIEGINRIISPQRRPLYISIYEEQIRERPVFCHTGVNEQR